MNIAIFGGFGKRMLAPGWTNETAIAIAGGGDFDLTGVTPGDKARLTAFAMFGGIDIIVDDDTNVTMGGFSMFGSREVTTSGGGEQSISVRAIALFGGVDVKPPKLPDQS